METSTLVESTLRWLRLDDTVRGLRAMRAFGVAAGPRIGARARAERLRGRTLYVRVASSGWSQELHVLRAAILERMHTLPGGDEVEALRFDVGDVEALPEWREDATPQGTSPAPTALPRPVLDPPVDAALADVADEELRATLASLMARSAADALQPRRPPHRAK